MKGRLFTTQLLQEAEPEVGRIPFHEMAMKYGKRLGLVVKGAGQPYNEWVVETAKILKEEGIIPQDRDPVFEFAALITGNVKGDQGRHDLIMIFVEAPIEIGRLAMFRLRWAQTLSWVDDFIVNYGRDYSSGGYNRRGRDDDDEDSGSPFLHGPGID